MGALLWAYWSTLFVLTTSSELAQQFFHDFAGLTMVPRAVMMLIFALWVMSRLAVDDSAG